LKRRNQPPQYYKKVVSISNGLLCTILFYNYQSSII
jgi:hypothetical protein